jgi:hypothetical protein
LVCDARQDMLECLAQHPLCFEFKPQALHHVAFLG